MSKKNSPDKPNRPIQILSNPNKIKADRTANIVNEVRLTIAKDLLIDSQ